MFCPECGKALAESAPETKDAETRASVAVSHHPAVKTPGVAEQLENKTAEPKSNKKKARTANGPEDRGRHTARERTRETLHRASNVARGAIEDNVKRVEKIHHVSTVMLEEATYDPSLRFVLVALGLFVIFVILLVVSKVMG
jgi:hypothetical protein